MATVLSISSDDALATTRRLILEEAGHRVVTAFTVHEVERACSAETFDVALIGQGLPRGERLRARELLRTQCPTAKVLELYLARHGKALADADDWMEVPSDTPAELAQRVSALASRKRSRRRKSAAP